jgi:hypothetical protein
MTSSLQSQSHTGVPAAALPPCTSRHRLGAASRAICCVSAVKSGICWMFLHADRTSCHTFAAHQFRVFLHSAAYVLMHPLRTKGLHGTAWGKAPFDQMQMRLLKVGARVEALKTKVTWHFPRAFPWKELYQTVLANLSRTDLCRSP